MYNRSISIIIYNGKFKVFNAYVKFEKTKIIKKRMKISNKAQQKNKINKQI